MPFEWNDILVVSIEELVPNYFSSSNTLYSQIQRYLNKPYGLKRVQLGGNGRQMLIAFDSLPKHIQEGLGDPRKVGHILERFYKVDGEAVTFYSTYQFPDDRSYIDQEIQERYITNASVVKALLSLKAARITERKNKGGNLRGLMASLCADAISFQKTLKVKHQVQHSLPESLKRFNECLKKFEVQEYVSLISGRHGNTNGLKVTESVLALLENMFAKDVTKPTATEVHAGYQSFIDGHTEIVNNLTGELYDRANFKALSVHTVTTYLAQWKSRIATHAARSGDRQKYMQQFKTPHSLDKPKFAGSILSIDDRQPPFIYNADKKRVWFYNGIDLASEAFTCWVHGRTKEGIIEDFYRQLLRNYHGWGLNLPAELEAEMSLNSSFVNTFLREGAMFQYVRIEANNARGKRIEAYYRPLRYKLEKKRVGWLARPFALSESNQAGPEQAKIVPYDEIIEGCLRDIETWNNMPHSVHTDMTRWDVFVQNQNPKLQPTNYLAILPHLGYKTPTSCNTGVIRLQSGQMLLGNAGKVSTGDQLIGYMEQVEGKNVDVYWIDDNEGKVFKALVYIGTQFICEAVAKPSYVRARIEQTEQDVINRELMSSYVMTIEAFGKRQKRELEPVTIINNQRPAAKSFVMPGLPQFTHAYEPAEVLPELPDEDEDIIIQAPPARRALRDRF